MTLAELSEGYGRVAQTKALIKELSGKSGKSIFLKGLHCSSAPLLFCNVARNVGRSCVLIVLNDQEEAAYFYHDMVQTVGDQNVLYFPSAYRRAAKYGQKDDASGILRTEVLSRITTLEPGGKALVIVTSPDALAETVASKRSLEDRSVQLSVGQTIDRDELQERLFNLGFERVDYVYEPGQYALRGSILDVFSFSSEYPLRIDFFGDDIDSIRQFSVETQLSTDKRDSVVIVPDMNSGAGVEQVSLLDFLPQDTLLAVKDMLLTADRIGAVGREVADQESLAARMREIDASAKNAPDGSQQPTANSQQLTALPSLITTEDFLHKTVQFRTVEFGNKPTGVPGAVIEFNTEPQPLFHKNFELVSKTLTDYIVKGYRIYILTDNPKQGERLEAIFAERGENIPFETIGKTLHEGYADGLLKCCFFTDHQIFDRFHKYSLRSERARNGKVALTLKELQEFQIGDYVVHIDHGVGKFGGLVRVPEAGGYQEKIKIIYKNDDVVFVSIHALHKVSKYKGKEGEEPHINKLGTGAWENLKERTKGKIKDIARDLIKLYAKRLEEKGFAYSPDTYMQNELEASFMYEDTPDQLKATLDVKQDMESSRPMDRLVCGDVGFGKTEVAIRAAFKAVADNKQVAVLVPTTILAFQHYQTFSERLKDFPCRVEYLSRARSAAKVTAILEDLKAGKIDIVIGTHKLIGKQVKFKDLGLLIIDEEQKFGVSVKEKLKQLRANVDVLTMTATPIPRTLQFSLMGARDLSVIQTPPPNRYPIQTEVHVFSADIIREAVNFEMSRNGQLFIVSNRISSLPDLAATVQREVPDARVAIGHGQMDPDELEKILTGFINYDYDVLVATSIIENGIDIPNANTIIVNQAQNFGLSDLHQMRGRVGRSNRKAFCYLLAPPLSALSDESRRRLQAIESFSELGSGIQLALQDLDIRGAGNLLGAEQSGFIADLGYETYQKILKEAVRELKNDEFQDLFKEQRNDGGSDSRNDGITDASRFVDECTVETDLDLFFPDSFVPDGAERILLYRELDSMERETDIQRFRERLQDRFGQIPKQALELIRLVTLRRMGRELGIERIFLKGGRMSLFFVSNPDSPYYESSSFGAILAYAAQNPLTCRLREDGTKRSLAISNVPDVENAINILQTVQQ
ncbi:MAG: transcription-repair coupling factor [Bacteroidaceae bacterium]|nr:transcription-repair coupling factor [Bacteroidaceae bacterium]